MYWIVPLDCLFLHIMCMKMIGVHRHIIFFEQLELQILCYISINWSTLV
jgi:hypothetical protein